MASFEAFSFLAQLHEHFRNVHAFEKHSAQEVLGGAVRAKDYKNPRNLPWLAM